MKPNKSMEDEDGSTVDACSDVKHSQTHEHVEEQVASTVQDQEQQEAEAVQEASKPQSRSIESYIASEVGKLTGLSRIFQDENDSSEVAVFHRSEVNAATLLGNGAFSEVYQVWGFCPSETASYPPHMENSRDFLVDTVLNEYGYSRYVIKHLRQDIGANRNTNRFVHAASDLVMEAKFLSKLDHPNIISLRGWSGGLESYAEGNHDSFFMILDRLDQTLSHRIMQWQVIPFCRQQVHAKKLMDYREKIDIGLQIAKGLEYLHSKDIIFRDLKPDNIGFRGNTVQIFDFGLCRELPMPMPDPEEVFHMSGVGTRRYMAPEIFVSQYYNLKADVYSWTIVFHTMLSLRRPFEMYDAAMHKLLVCQDAVRPTILPNWPAELQDLLKQGWTHRADQRPTMSQVVKRLEHMISKIEGRVAPPPNIFERSMELMDKYLGVNMFCENNCSSKAPGLPFDKEAAGNVLRLIESQMVTGAALDHIHSRHHSTERPHYQHLRSSYL